MRTCTKRYITYLLTTVTLFSLAEQAWAEQETAGQAAWDNTINSLLATSMYGIGNPKNSGLSVQFQGATDLYKGLAADQSPLNGQAITFSYDGSSGLLEFSAGYIYTVEQQNDGAVFLGIDPVEYQSFNPTRSWYMAFDLSGSYAYDENVNFGFGSKTMLMKNPFDTEEGKLFSMLFNMPISYKNYITITPQVQWSRTLPPEAGSEATLSTSPDEQEGENIFYGGVSISFSY